MKKTLSIVAIASSFLLTSLLTSQANAKTEGSYLGAGFDSKFSSG
jgi:hypothetical protein